MVGPVELMQPILAINPAWVELPMDLEGGSSLIKAVMEPIMEVLAWEVELELELGMPMLELTVQFRLDPLGRMEGDLVEMVELETQTGINTDQIPEPVEVELASRMALLELGAWVAMVGYISPGSIRLHSRSLMQLILMGPIMWTWFIMVHLISSRSLMQLTLTELIVRL